MNLVLFDDPLCRNGLLPLSWTRPVAQMRVGILTIAQKWERRLGVGASFFTHPNLTAKYPFLAAKESLWINGALCPDPALVEAIQELPTGACLARQSLMLAARADGRAFPDLQKTTPIEYTADVTLIDRLWKIIEHNGAQLQQDYALITHGRTSASLSDRHSVAYGVVGGNIFLEEGAKVRCAVLNAEEGPIYIGENTIVHECTSIQGPFALCEGGQTHMGARMRSNSTVGPYCKVGGEISNSVLMGFSNKAHEGFMGHSVVGEWCNLGAGSHTSNLKNNYGEVKLWDAATGQLTPSGMQFCGLFMGDYSKCAIGTLFNTGTVAGVGCNIFGVVRPPKYIPSFTWGEPGSGQLYHIDELIKALQKGMKRRSRTLNAVEEQLIRSLFHEAQSGNLRP